MIAGMIVMIVMIVGMIVMIVGMIVMIVGMIAMIVDSTEIHAGGRSTCACFPLCTAFPNPFRGRWEHPVPMPFVCRAVTYSHKLTRGKTFPSKRGGMGCVCSNVGEPSCRWVQDTPSPSRKLVGKSVTKPGTGTAAHNVTHEFA